MHNAIIYAIVNREEDDLSDLEFRILAMMASLYDTQYPATLDPSQHIHVSLATYARKMHRSVRSINKAIKNLETNGFIISCGYYKRVKSYAISQEKLKFSTELPERGKRNIRAIRPLTQRPQTTQTKGTLALVPTPNQEVARPAPDRCPTFEASRPAPDHSPWAIMDNNILPELPEQEEFEEPCSFPDEFPDETDIFSDQSNLPSSPTLPDKRRITVATPGQGEWGTPESVVKVMSTITGCNDYSLEKYRDELQAARTLLEQKCERTYGEQLEGGQISRSTFETAIRFEIERGVLVERWGAISLANLARNPATLHKAIRESQEAKREQERKAREREKSTGIRVKEGVFIPPPLMVHPLEPHEKQPVFGTNGTKNGLTNLGDLLPGERGRRVETAVKLTRHWSYQKFLERGYPAEEVREAFKKHRPDELPDSE